MTFIHCAPLPTTTVAKCSPQTDSTKHQCFLLLNEINSHYHNIVITVLFHSVKTASPSENACASKAASIIVSMHSGSRLSKLLFLPYLSKLENVAVSFVFELLVCNKSELVENFQL
jgi:hypothetical protein